MKPLWTKAIDDAIARHPEAYSSEVFVAVSQGKMNRDEFLDWFVSLQEKAYNAGYDEGYAEGEELLYYDYE